MMMNWMLGITGAFVGSLLIQLPAQEPATHSLKTNITLSSSSLKQTELSEAQVCALAEKITIKILSENTIAEGTGILTKKEQGKDKFIYTVLTNDHVVRDIRNYQVETYDKRVYPATLEGRYGQDSLGDDLAILQFNSTRSYNLATFGFRATSPLDPGDRVFAAGFPVAAAPSVSRGFKCESGQISLILDREMKWGYQVGYFVDIEKGMSGGPLLNSKGEVVGINGKHSHPLPIGRAEPLYVYKNGEQVSIPEIGNLLDNSSWAIAIDKLREAKYAFIIPPIPSIPSPVPPKPAPPQPKPKPPTPPPPTITNPIEQELHCNSTMGQMMDLFPLNDDRTEYVSATLSCPDERCRLTVTRKKNKPSIHPLNNIFAENKPVEERDKVFNIRVLDLYNPGEKETIEPEVFVGLIDPNEEENCYYWVYRYEEDSGKGEYKKDLQPIRIPKKVEEGD